MRCIIVSYMQLRTVRRTIFCLSLRVERTYTIYNKKIIFFNDMVNGFHQNKHDWGFNKHFMDFYCKF